MAILKASEYRDLISDVADTLRSAQSAADDAELSRECDRLLPKVKELQQATCKRASQRDRQWAGYVEENARTFLFSTLMYLNDNQRIEAEYLGMN